MSFAVAAVTEMHKLVNLTCPTWAESWQYAHPSSQGNLQWRARMNTSGPPHLQQAWAYLGKDPACTSGWTQNNPISGLTRSQQWICFLFWFNIVVHCPLQAFSLNKFSIEVDTQQSSSWKLLHKKSGCWGSMASSRLHQLTVINKARKHFVQIG